MTINPDYKFTVSLSKDIYRNKEQTTAAITSDEKGGKWLREKCGLKDKLCFKAKTIIPSQLLDMSLDGHTFCSLFGNFTTPPPKKTYIRKDGYFTMEGKCSQFFQGSYFIGVDIDDTKYTPREFISFLRLKPTLWYTSLSHMKEDKNKDGQLDSRFRLIYVFDSLIQDPYYFRYYASTLYKMIEKDTVENIEDKCGMRCSQYFNGTYVFDEDPNIDFELNNYIYSLNDISVSDEGYLEFLSKGCEYSNITKEHKENISDRIFKLLFQSDIIKKENKQQIILEWNKTLKSKTNDEFESNLTNLKLLFQSDIIKKENKHIISEWNKSIKNKLLVDIDFDQQMIYDYGRYEWDRFYDTYRFNYHSVYRTEKEDWLTLVLKKGDDINYVKYQYCDDDFLELNWINLKKDEEGKLIKRGNGNHRRDSLYHRCWLRRVIKPTITPNELLFNLMCDKERFFDDAKDGVLDINFLKTKVQQCFSHDIDYFTNKHRSVYDGLKDVCSRKRFIIHWQSSKYIKPNSLSKELRWQLLDRFYDQELPLEENLQILKDSDIEDFQVGLSRQSLYRYCTDRGIEIMTKSKIRKKKFLQLHVEGMKPSEEQRYLKEKGLELSIKTITKYREELLKKTDVA